MFIKFHLSTTQMFEEGKTIDEYLRGSGTKCVADSARIYDVTANGTVRVHREVRTLVLQQKQRHDARPM
ncbi:hypothetical protein GCM10025776_04940 [Corallincola platygyrae]